MPFLLWSVRSRLTALFEGVFASDASVEVFDGPRTRSTPRPTFLLVGVGGDVAPSTDPEASEGGSARHEMVVFGPRLDEVGGVPCTLVSWSGSADLAGPRAVAADKLAECEAAIAADPTLGGLLLGEQGAFLDEVSVRERQTSKGAVVEVVFNVAYRAAVS